MLYDVTCVVRLDSEEKTDPEIMELMNKKISEAVQSVLEGEDISTTHIEVPQVVVVQDQEEEEN